MINKDDEKYYIYEDDDFEGKKIKLLHEMFDQVTEQTNSNIKINQYNVKKNGLIDSSLLFDDEDIAFAKWLDKMDDVEEFIYEMPDWLFYEDEEEFDYNDDDIFIKENGECYDLSNCLYKGYK